MMCEGDWEKGRTITRHVEQRGEEQVESIQIGNQLTYILGNGKIIHGTPVSSHGKYVEGPLGTRGRIKGKRECVCGKGEGKGGWKERIYW